MTSAAFLFVLALDTAAVRCAHDVFGSVSGIWPGWTDAPFSVLIVEDDAEYLLGASSVPAAFERLPKDADGFTVHRRKRTFAPNLLATFPAFSTEPTIVVGTPAATGKSRTPWIFTLRSSKNMDSSRARSPRRCAHAAPLVSPRHCAT